MRHRVYRELHGGWDDGNTREFHWNSLEWAQYMWLLQKGRRISPHCWHRCVSSGKKQLLAHPIAMTTKGQTGASISSLSVNTWSLYPCRSHKDILFIFLFSCFCCLAFITLFSFYSLALYCILPYCTVCCLCQPEWRINFITTTTHDFV